MPAPILATKLSPPPPRPGLVARPRLIARLNAGLAQGGKVSLISAPAGFGKTTLAGEWVANDERPAAWLSLDPGDNDPARFLAYLVTAVHPLTHSPGAPDTGAGLLEVLQAPQPPMELVLTRLLNALADLPEHCLLVLDDYHTLDAPAIDQALAFLIDHQPPRLHLVIATREDPSLSLARLRARGQLTELRTADLRFTPAEAAEFLNRVMGLALSPDDITTLETRTEGWIAGLQLAALSMQGVPDAAAFLRSFTGSHRFVLDYLMEEVLGRQPEGLQQFLLRTAILDRLCGPLCEAVLAAPPGAGQATLEQLERANLFIVPLDHERRWYRYHHLFGDLLRQRLGQHPPRPDDHRRASAWWEAHHDLAEAFRHALAADDAARAADLVEALWQGMERNFQTNAWIGWVKQLPEAAIRARPWLCVHLGWAYSDVGELSASEAALQMAERALAGRPADAAFNALPATIALIRAGNAQINGDLAATVTYATQASQLAPEPDAFLRAQAAITLGFTQWATGEVPASLQAMQAWVADMHQLGNPMYAIASAFVLADMHLTLGHLGAAEAALQQALQAAAAHGPEAEVVTAHHQLGLALLAHERGETAAAAQRLKLAAELGQRTTLIDWPYRWRLAQARLKESAGEWEAALALLDDAQRVYIKNPIPPLQPITAHQARLHLKLGRLDRAQAWARDRHLSPADEVSYLCEYEHLTLARVRLADGALAGIPDLLGRLLALAEAQHRAGSMLEILLTQALVYQAQADRPRALAALERALTLAAPEGYQRTLVEAGDALQLLITDFRATIAPRAHPLRAYVDRLLGHSPPPTAARPASSSPATPVTALIDPLSARELEVLRLLRSELSGPEIARHLSVSLHTVRTHTKNIFSKLGVNNRRAAVRQAEALRLF